MDRVLARELGRVRAPEELWERIASRTQSCVPRSHSRERVVFSQVACRDESRHGTQECVRHGVLQALAAAALLAVVMWISYPRALAIQSSDSSRIRDWVKAYAGVNVPLLAQLPSSLRLTGARVSQGRAEINCRVGDRDVKLIVARTGSSVPDRHNVPERGRRTVSWSMSGQSYTLACTNPEDLKIACLLCHSGGA